MRCETSRKHVDVIRADDAHSRHPLRRLRHAALAAVARAVPEAAAAAGRRAHDAAGDRGAARAGCAGLAAPVVVCNESHRFMVAEQLRESGAEPQAIMLEPVGRNTAPAVAVAALVALERARAKGEGGADADPLLLVLPADHVIRDVEAFQRGRDGGPRRRRRGQARHVRRRARPPGDRLRLHPARAGRRARPTRSPSSSRSPTPRRPSSTSRRATTSGTAACSCSAPARYLDELARARAGDRSRPASARSPRRSAISTSRGCRPPSSAPAPATPSTTR